MGLEATVCSVLGAGGEFSRSVAGFVPRKVQGEFAAAVAAAIEARAVLVAEAGTGTGKTFAYLAPILLGGRRAVIATATRALQDQLFERDLPLAAQALGRPVNVALLKGRANYLCRERFRQLQSDLVGDAGIDLVAVAAWARSTRTGDLAELPDLGEGAGARRLLTMSAEACLGSACTEYGRCHVYAARRRAQEADVVIVNHHLLVADYAMKAEGGNLLGDAAVVVVDEAHALVDVARTSLGDTVSFGQLGELAEDARRVWVKAYGPDRLSPEREASFNDLHLSHTGLAAGRYEWAEVAARLQAPLRRAAASLQALIEDLEGLPDAAPLLARAHALAVPLCRWTDECGTESEPGDFRWVEVRSGGAVSLHVNPLEPGTAIGQWVADGEAAWIFSSATLAVAGHFDATVRELGLSDPRTLLAESPFDYGSQARLYLPRGLPAVNAPGYTDAVVEAASPLIEAAGGGCFLLFTSHQALRRAATLMRSRSLAYPLFVQDEAPRARLLAQFRAAGNGVLLGTASFWEGVDVKGDALVLVVIDRLPFASPADPLMRARLDHCREQGGNPFSDIQLPEAVMALKQGAGRLIRDGSDRGLLMVCDPRLRSRAYGRVFLRSLPPMTVIDELAQATAFLSAARQVQLTAPARSSA